MVTIARNGRTFGFSTSLLDVSNNHLHMLSVNKNNMKLRHYEDFEIFYILIVMSSQFMQFIVSNYATMSKSAILKVERQLPNNAGYPQNIVRCLTKNIGSTDNINECSTLQHNPVSKISNYC